jgi:serine/threonine protein phosphatase PrpC
MIRSEVRGLWIGEGWSAGKIDGKDAGAHTIASFEPPFRGAASTILVVMARAVPVAGQRGGEVAGAALAAVVDAFDEDSGGNITQRLARGFETASEKVAALGDGECLCAAVVISGRRLYLANVGDGRIFLRRNGALRQVSVTHTFSHSLVEQGAVSEVELTNMTIRDALTRALGYDRVEVDLRLRLSDGDDDETARLNQGVSLRPGDRVILTASGTFPKMLFPHMYQAFHLDILRDETEAQDAVDRFIAACRDDEWPAPCRVVALDIPDRC